MNNNHRQIIVCNKFDDYVDPDLFDAVTDRRYRIYLSCSRCHGRMRFTRPCYLTSIHNMVRVKPNDKTKHVLLAMLNRKTMRHCKRCRKNCK